MIFFLNQNGTCERKDTDHIYQGSNGVSKVIAITNISPAQSYVQVAFTLPNGLTVGYLPTELSDIKAAYKGSYQVGADVDNQMYLWELDLPYNVTEVQGDVGVSFNAVNSVTGANMTSYTNTFTVEYSALPIPPASASESELEQILNLLNAYYAQNTGIITTHTSQIQAIQVEQTTQNNAISTLQAQSTSLQKAVTKNTSDIAEIKTEQAQQDEEIEKLKEASVIGETPVGTLPGSATLPTDAQIQQYYTDEVGREPRIGDVFFFTQTLASGYKVYKYIYGVTGWAYYELPNAITGSNRNMFRNPNWAINQRGKETYTSSGYTADGWRTYILDNETVEITPQLNGGIKAIAQVGNVRLRQIFETSFTQQLIGKTVTVSFKSILSASRLFLNIIDQTDAQTFISHNFVNVQAGGIVSYTFVVPQCSSLAIQIGCAASNGVMWLDWGKFEIGDVATEFTPPSPQENLAECQRYFVAIGSPSVNINIAYAQAVTATIATAVLTLPLPLNKAPTLTFDNLVIRKGATDITPTSVTVNAITNNLLYLQIVASNLTSGDSYMVRLNQSALYIDAEL